MESFETASTPKRLFDHILLWIGYWVSLTAGLWVYDILTSRPLLATDFGQWIMFSRYYLGESTPAYLDPRSVHPLLPIILALVTSLVKDSIHSIVIISAVFYFLLVLTAFWAAKELFQSNMVAVLATLLTSFGQYILIYMTVGLLPQLGAIIGINVALIALARIGKDREQHFNWLLLSFSLLLVSFSHMPSAPLFFLSVIISLVYLGCLNRGYLRMLGARAIIYLPLPIIAWISYFLLYYDVMIEYVINKAGYYRRGIDILSKYLTVSEWVFAIAILGISSLIFVLFLALNNKDKHFRYAAGLILIWFIVPGTFMVVSYLLKVGTDYGRFIYYFVEPPIFALAYSIYFLAKKIPQKSSLHQIYLSRSRLINFGYIVKWASSFVVLLILAKSTYFTLQFYPVTVYDLSLEYGSSFLNVVSWLKTVPDNETIFAPSRPEATWIEGLSGRATIFPEEFAFIYRPGMMDRSLAADLINTGINTAIENGLVYLRFQQLPKGLSFNPNIAVYHQGDYTNLFTLQDRLISITMSGDKKLKLNLGQGFDQNLETELANDGTSSRVISSYRSSIQVPLIVTKTISVSKDSPVVTIEVEFKTDKKAKIEAINFQIADVIEPTTEEVIKRAYVKSVISKTNEITIVRKEASGQDVVAILTLSPNPSRVTAIHPIKIDRQAYLEISFNESKQAISKIQMTLIPQQVQGRYREEFKRYSLFDVLKSYRIGYLVINQTNFQAQTVYDKYEFPKAYSNWNYIIYRVPGG